MAKKTQEPSRSKQFIDRIHKTMAEFEDIPEKLMYELLVEEAEGWKMRLEELEDPDGD